MQVTITIPPTTCVLCVETAGIMAIIDQTTWKATLDDSLLPQLAVWTTVPPPPHNHPPVDNSAACLAWDAWLEERGNLLSIPPATLDPAQDEFVTLRARVTARLAALEATARALGPPQ